MIERKRVGRDVSKKAVLPRQGPKANHLSTPLLIDQAEVAPTESGGNAATAYKIIEETESPL